MYSERPSYVGIIGFIVSISAIMFFFVEIIAGAAISALVAREGFAVAIVYIGFLVSSLLAFFSTIITKDQIPSDQRGRINIADAVALVLNLMLWTLIAYIVAGVGRDPATTLAIFALYYLDSFVLMWLLAGLTHAILFVITLRIWDVTVVD